MRTRALPSVTVALLLAAIACGGSSPTNPSNPPPGNTNSCRTYWTAFTHTTVAGTLVANQSTTCSFDRPSLQFRCTHNYSDNQPTQRTFNTVSTYGSVDDIVDELNVVPPRQLVLTAATVNGHSVTYSYDAQKRLTRAVSTAGATQTYTAWDSFGRPTAATDVGPGFNNTHAISYNNTARTRTTVVVNANVTTVEIFDANGFVTSTVATSTVVGAPAVSTMTALVSSTGQVCK
jgi:YD repeat-containing protein